MWCLHDSSGDEGDAAGDQPQGEPLQPYLLRFALQKSAWLMAVLTIRPCAALPCPAHL